MADLFKPITMSPLTGVFDSRSTSDQIAAGSFSWIQNWEVNNDGKRKNARGFTKPYNINPTVQQSGGQPCAYQNWDWHNQGVAAASREPMTLLFPSTANDGSRRLYAATKTRIILMDESAGTWSQIGGPFGADGSQNNTQLRFKADQLQNTIVFTNAFDKVMYHVIGSGTVQEITDLNTAGSDGTLITKAKVVIQYNGVMMIMNVNEAGVDQPSRIWWSDLNLPLSWNEATLNSISDFQDLPYGENILAAVVVQGFLYVFTDKSIWRCTFAFDPTTGDATLSCTQVYVETENNHMALVYPNTLVSDGFNMRYAGSDGIYTYNAYMAQPEFTPWINSSTNFIFDSGNMKLDTTSCESPVMHMWPDSNEIYLSWPVVDVTLVAPQTNCNVPPPLASSGLNYFTLVINTKFNTTDFRDFGMMAYCNFKSDPALAGGDCNIVKYFFGAFSLDYCIKQIGNGYAREIYDPVKDVFDLTGYTPLLRGVFPFGDFALDKYMKDFVIDGQVDSNDDNMWNLRIGNSFTQMDPNNTVAGCGVIWHSLNPKPIKCPFTKTATGYAQSNVRPSTPNQFNFLYRDRFLYYELSITDANGNPPTTGSVTISRFDVKAMEA